MPPTVLRSGSVLGAVLALTQVLVACDDAVVAGSFDAVDIGVAADMAVNADVALDGAADAVSVDMAIPDATGDAQPELAEHEETQCPHDWAEDEAAAPEVFVGAAFTHAFVSCRAAAHFAVLAAGVEARLVVYGLAPNAQLEVRQVDGMVLGAASADLAGRIEHDFTVARSGEVRLRLRSAHGLDASQYHGTLECTGGC